MNSFLKKYIKANYIIGIDEAGRGPLAGGVMVGAVAILRNTDISFLRGIRDSKKLTEMGREEWFLKIKNAEKSGVIRTSYSWTSAHVIDRVRIVEAVNRAMKRAIFKLELPPNECLVLLDGSLSAPEDFLFQETIIRGDDKIPLISAAAIIAKVSRDRRMVRLAKKYPEWNFDVHKGYGTKEHYKRISLHGLSDIHRRTYCKV